MTVKWAQLAYLKCNPLYCLPQAWILCINMAESIWATDQVWKSCYGHYYNATPPLSLYLYYFTYSRNDFGLILECLSYDICTFNENSICELRYQCWVRKPGLQLTFRWILKFFKRVKHVCICEGVPVFYGPCFVHSKAFAILLPPCLILYVLEILFYTRNRLA